MIEYLDEKGIDGDMYSFIEGLVADKVGRSFSSCLPIPRVVSPLTAPHRERRRRNTPSTSSG